MTAADYCVHVRCLRTAAIVIWLAVVMSSAHGNVYVDYFIPSMPVAEPFAVSAGESFKSVMADGTSHVAISGGSIVNIDESITKEPLRLLDDATAEITGGILQVDTRPGVTFSTPCVYLEDNSQISISGGRIEAFGSGDVALRMRNRSKGTISGGEFRTTNGYTVNTTLDAELSISGGTFNNTASGSYSAVLRLQSDVPALITGGSFVSAGTSGRGIDGRGPFLFSNASVESTGFGIAVYSGTHSQIFSGSVHAATEALQIGGVLDIFGGDFEGADVDLYLASGVVNIYARSATLDGLPVGFGSIAATAGELSIVYRDGTSELLRFQRPSGTLNLIYIPEPGSASALLAGMTGSLSFYRRRWNRR